MKHLLLLIAFGTIATLGAGHVAAHYGQHFMIPPELQKYNPPFPDEILAKLTVAERIAARKNAALTGGTIGGLFAGLVGLAAALSVGRGIGKGVVALLCGLVLGVALGAGGGVLNQTVYAALRQSGSDPFVMTAVAHAAMWLCIAVAYAVTLRVATGDKGPGLAHSAGVLLACGAISAALYPFLAAALLPLAKADLPVPRGDLNVLFWIGMPALLFNVAAGRMLNAHGKPASEGAEPAESSSTDPAPA